MGARTKRISLKMKLSSPDFHSDYDPDKEYEVILEDDGYRIYWTVVGEGDRIDESGCLVEYKYSEAPLAIQKWMVNNIFKAKPIKYFDMAGIIVYWGVKVEESRIEGASPWMAIDIEDWPKGAIHYFPKKMDLPKGWDLFEMSDGTNFINGMKRVYDE